MNRSCSLLCSVCTYNTNQQLSILVSCASETAVTRSSMCTRAMVLPESTEVGFFCLISPRLPFACCSHDTTPCSSCCKTCYQTWSDFRRKMDAGFILRGLSWAHQLRVEMELILSWNMQKILQQASEAEEVLKYHGQTLPSLHNTPMFLFFGSYIFSFLAQLKYCHQCFLVKTVSLENLLQFYLICTKIYFQAFISKTQRLDGNFIF